MLNYLSAPEHWLKYQTPLLERLLVNNDTGQRVGISHSYDILGCLFVVFLNQFFLTCLP